MVRWPGQCMQRTQTGEMRGLLVLEIRFLLINKTGLAACSSDFLWAFLVCLHFWTAPPKYTFWFKKKSWPPKKRSGELISQVFKSSYQRMLKLGPEEKFFESQSNVDQKSQFNAFICAKPGLNVCLGCTTTHQTRCKIFARKGESHIFVLQPFLNGLLIYVFSYLYIKG